MRMPLTERVTAMIEYGVVTVEGREEYLAGTKSSLNIPSLQVFKDKGDSLLSGHRIAWSNLFEGEADYACLFQDDVKACKNVGDALDYVARNYDIPVLTLFSKRKAVREAEEGIVKLRPSKFVNEQGVLLRKDVHESFCKWLSDGRFMEAVSKTQDVKHHDYLLQRFFVEQGIPVYATNPSLLQHIGRDSEMGNPWKVAGRTHQTKTFRQDADALEIVVNATGDFQ